MAQVQVFLSYAFTESVDSGLNMIDNVSIILKRKF